FQTALRLDPKLAAAAYGVALCRERAGDDTGVQTWMQNTLKASPSHFAAGLATTRDKGEDSIQGLIQLSGGKASPPELAQAWSLVGTTQLGQGRYDEAEASFKKALGAFPASVPGKVGLGETYHELGRYKEANDQLESAHAAAPTDLEVLLAQSRTQLALGQPFVAQDLLA